MSPKAENVGGQGLLSTGAIIKAKAIEVEGLVSGTKYKWGGRDLEGFDCSGFVSYVLAEAFPGKAALLKWLTTASIASSEEFTKVPSAAVGDLIYFDQTDGSDHVGIVLDEETWIGSQSSTGVARVKLSNSWWSKNRPTRYFYRFKSQTTAAAARVGL